MGEKKRVKDTISDVHHSKVEFEIFNRNFAERLHQKGLYDR